ncbi:trimeric intracellular cation channel family protein [Paracoccus methylarcula]|uniref:Trimeric intracellular cation channel family protein n=1 Tax=Paracoccus methylarcula TaxID=72022 RepID=A0A3R7M8X7_9RHOB|nr:trimeric intracellular cation channel family protein [Paracoccus methylarcula]RNF34293.1 trimeric intracellular cation channel family protein [Paracoccus methylarcula]
MSFAGLLVALDYGSVLIFALTGALVASRAQLDPVGFIFMAALTAVGGGTLRDLILGRETVFWVEQPAYILIAAGAALLVFWTAHLFESRYRLLVWLDSVALAVAVAAGVGVAMEEGHGPVIIVIMGIVTGTFGGLMRDVVGNEVPLVLKQGQLYLTAAFGGALMAAAMDWLEFQRGEALIACATLVWVLRAGSLIWGWKLPVYRPRPPRMRG